MTDLEQLKLLFSSYFQKIGYVGFKVHEEPWNDETSYTPNSLVTLNQTMYYAKIENTGVDPRLDREHETWGIFIDNTATYAAAVAATTAAQKGNEATASATEATRLANIALEEMATKMSACVTATTSAENAALSATTATTAANSAADRANSASERSETLILATQKALYNLITTTATANELVVKLDQNEQVRVVAEQERVSSETTRKTNEQARVDAEDARITAETKREQSAKENKDATDKAVADCQQAVRDAQVAVDYDPDTYSLIITTGT